MSVTTNILQRTFHIRCREASGTCFTLDVDGRRYLATARHVVAGIQGDGVIEIAHGNGKWLPLGVKLVGHGDGGAGFWRRRYSSAPRTHYRSRLPT